MTTLDGPRLPPLSGRTAQQLIVLLHGYGADGHDLIDIGKIWQTALVDTAFVAPHGPDVCELSPFGRQWFSLQNYDPDLLRRNPDRLEEAFEKFTGGVRTAQSLLEDFIHRELDDLSLDWHSVVLVGFSQGTMLSLFTGLRQPRPPAGILGFSGALIGASILDKEITCRPPVALLHGQDDDILPYPSMALAQKGLTKAGVEVTTHSQPGLGHSIDMKGIEIGANFLKQVFSS